MKAQHKNLILLTVGSGLIYYFFVYLPEEEKKQQKKQRLINEEIQRKEFERQQADRNAEENRQRIEAEKLRKQANIITKKLHWRRERDNKSWTDDWLARKKESFEKMLQNMGGEEEIHIFDVAADYAIHFPPLLWTGLTEEQRTLAKSKGHGELELDEKTKGFKFNELVEEWYNNVVNDPVRGEPDPQTEKDNNALFYGTGGTGKTSLVRKLAHEADLYPLIEIKGPNLTPSKEDYDNGIDNLNKFIFTLSDIENTLEDNYNFQREENGEVRYILFVDECDNICTNKALSTDYTKLIFLKTCMEGIKKSAQSQNLWIFATNYIHLIDPPVYREGRLSNPLDFSWTLGDLKHYCTEAEIINQWPQHWLKLDTLNEEDNKWVNRFNTMNFKRDFLKFWQKFITHQDTLKQLVEETEMDEKGNEIITKKGIPLGEFLQFFWSRFDSKQLHNFTGRYEKPNKPTVEELIPKITEAVDVRLKEMSEKLTHIKEDMKFQKEDYISVFSNKIDSLSTRLTEITKKIG